MKRMGHATASTAATDPSDALAAALGRIPSGLFVLTATSGGAETGMLASWVQQCSFDPPQVTVAVNKERDVLDALHTHGHTSREIRAHAVTAAPSKLGVTSCCSASSRHRR